ncbi:UDP-N-acetylmuramyl peptide synthase [Methylacidiphilum kamchatkense Kam1]|uniref:UDP-N-acetylmuramoyl-L-alanyl-D-glutamate--2,6-diaminopimelate ligase n=1 Tax=Methylacidiphilum kamchatkense Kam1 TaxID=1202785 RepID=A0A0C1V6M3_9BACT|nr:UDP-N-acetylmuramoyl-L-alanyl-D-glutamate--2,6-diaminopimelate ligase [Methylacidiphilum kamchatkense]KIE59370.1 UDP-N-acetylmuramyl peptide synthase [Methylacidiphilum kamchatkense Kam1]QDQ42653.1 UDP-N-acetylmuramoylalanyl-D-glutamate--2,6-diaminopimelate ligase [Methylacidiphilum kamchatkense Kam1]
MKLSDVLSDLEPLAIKGSIDWEINTIVYDSRKVVEGSLFFAWKGQKTDGHRYIVEAIERGARGVICSEMPAWQTSKETTFVQVKDPRRVLGKVASVFYGDPSSHLSVIGITGTNGKTTTSFLMRHLLATQGWKTGLIGTIYYDTTVDRIPASRTSPEGSDLQQLLFQMLKANCQAAVMEVSSHALEQGRIEGTEFRIGIFTNLTQDHLDYHQTMEAYRQSKEKFISYIRTRKEGEGGVVLNIDDPQWSALAEKLKGRVNMVTVSAQGKPAAKLKARSIKYDRLQTVILAEWAGQLYQLNSPLLGRFNVENLLLSLGGTLLLGIPLEAAIRALASFPGVPGRMERFYAKDGLLAIVDYAHSEDALLKVVLTLREIQSSGRIILVVGCGGDRDRTKRPKMAKVASDYADLVIFTSDNPRSESPERIFEDMKRGVDSSSKRIYWIVDRKEAIRKAIQIANPGDIVCVAGKGHETYQEIDGVFYPFDDRLVVRECLLLRD